MCSHVETVLHVWGHVHAEHICALSHLVFIIKLNMKRRQCCDLIQKVAIYVMASGK